MIALVRLALTAFAVVAVSVVAVSPAGAQEASSDPSHSAFVPATEHLPLAARGVELVPQDAMDLFVNPDADPAKDAVFAAVDEALAGLGFSRADLVVATAATADRATLVGAIQLPGIDVADIAPRLRALVVRPEHERFEVERDGKTLLRFEVPGLPSGAFYTVGDTVWFVIGLDEDVDDVLSRLP